MFASPLRTIICLGVMGTLFTGCATKTLMTKDNKTYTRTNKVTLIEDQVVAFGKPAQPLPRLAHAQPFALYVLLRFRRFSCGGRIARNFSAPRT